MKITILDDYHDTLRTLRCFGMLEGHEVTVWTEHTQDENVLAARLRGERPRSAERAIAGCACASGWRRAYHS